MSEKPFSFEFLLNDVVTQTNSACGGNSAKANKLRAIGEKAHKELSYVYPNLNTLSNKLSLVKSAIADNCQRHHMFDKSISTIEKKHPWVKNVILWNESTKPKVISARVRSAIEQAKNNSSKYDSAMDYEKRDEFLSIVSHLNSLKIFSESYYHLSLSDEQSGAIRSNRDERIKERLNSQITLGKFEVIDLTMELLKSKSHYELALGLALATGRRMAELYYSASFEKVNENRIKFTGQLKKKFWQGKNEQEVFLYTTVGADLVMDSFERFRTYSIVDEVRKTVDESKNITIINRKFSMGCGRVAKSKLYPLDINFDFKFSSARAIWGRMVFDSHFGDDEWKNCAEESFWQCMYGHETPSQQIDYKVFKFVDSKPIKTNLIGKGKTVDLDVLLKAEDEILETADFERLGFKPILLINAHIAVKDYVADNGSFEFKKSIFSLAKKRGGFGITPYIAKAYVSVIEKYI